MRRGSYGANHLTVPGCLKCQMGIDEIHVPVVGQLDPPNDQLPIVDVYPGGRDKSDDDVSHGRHGIPIEGLEHSDDLG